MRARRVSAVATKRVLVTGCSGFVGSHLTDACLARDWDVIGIDCLTPHYDPELKRANIREATADPSFTYLERHLLDSNLDLPGLLRA